MEDFKNGVEAFLESVVQTQKEVSKMVIFISLRINILYLHLFIQIISLWESYFQQMEAQQNSNLEDSPAAT